MTKLFSPITVRSITTKNRIWVAPMCMYSCEGKDGVVNQFHLVHYGERALGGAGLIIVEATAVRADGRITPGCTGIWSQEQVEAWKPVTAFLKANGAIPAIQLAHAGRKASTHRDGSGSITLADGGWQTVSSTDEAFTGYFAPRELETDELRGIVDAFVNGAKNAIAAGFEALEIHAAHGYLMHQFLSPISNHREDSYGGSLENRARLLVETVIAIRTAVGDGVPLFIRFSATDYKEGGWDETQTAQVAKWCAEAGADLFDISSGGLITGVTIPSGPGYQVPLSEFVAERVEEPVTAVGQITEAKQAEEILQRGEIEVVMIGRASLRDPHWPLRAAAELGVEVDWPTQYSRGKFPKN
ncbi:MAG: NADH:flavin oxidoreductase/NADH oxidase [Rhodoluna sp.]|nr:NADH:flavin oxidoreductase/NADH oxidase [Rhodoluna sp.]